jgi:two-component system, NtrC family, nitrogen regulation sensor histidine kinase NtrY
MVYNKLFKHFNVLVVVRLVLLIANVVVIASVFGDKRLFFTQIILFLVLIVQIVDLLRFIHHTNREITRFFLAIKHSDFSITFRHSELGKSFRELQQSMSDIIESYKQVKIEKEAQFHFLQMLINQIQIGIIALENDDITLINSTAGSLLGVPDLKNWKLLQQLNPKFTNEIAALGNTGRKLMEMTVGSERKFLSVDVSTATILNRTHKLITVQDINSEIEQKEIEAWHKLIRILTHEIMNSVTPISSLTETMQMLLTSKDGNAKKTDEITDELILDLLFSLQTIQKRSDGLLTFIENYRKLTRVPKPKIEPISIQNFLESIDKLLRAGLESKGISLSYSIQAVDTLHADVALLEQVIINLISNSTYALENVAQPKIQLKVFKQSSNTIIEVSDNGKGISLKELSEIFTPFFSTRKDGSGIGLSLSKQIMSVHGGTIKVSSEVNVGTSMQLIFARP